MIDKPCLHLLHVTKNNTQDQFSKKEFETWAINTKWLLLIRHIKTAVKQKDYTKKLAQKHTFQEDSLNYNFKRKFNRNHQIKLPPNHKRYTVVIFEYIFKPEYNLFLKPRQVVR